MNSTVQTLKTIIIVVACMLVVVTFALLAEPYFDKKMIEIQSREATEEAYNDYLNSPRYRATMRALMDQYNELKDK